MKQFLCDCTCPDYEELGIKDINEFIDFIDSADNITKEDFLKNCDIAAETKRDICKFRNDYDFYKNGEIYFFSHSRIEHFFKEVKIK